MCSFFLHENLLFDVMCALKDSLSDASQELHMTPEKLRAALVFDILQL